MAVSESEPNQAASGNGATRFLFRSARSQRAVPDQRRSGKG